MIHRRMDSLLQERTRLLQKLEQAREVWDEDWMYSITADLFSVEDAIDRKKKLQSLTITRLARGVYQVKCKAKDEYIVLTQCSEQKARQYGMVYFWDNPNVDTLFLSSGAPGLCGGNPPLSMWT